MPQNGSRKLWGVIVTAQQGLINALTQHLELDDLEFHLEGQCTVTFDDTLWVTFLQEDASQLTALGYIAPFNPDAAELSSFWLQFNFAAYALRGCYVALDAENQAVVLIRSWVADRIDGKSFIDDVTSFVNWMEVLRSEAQARQSEAGAPSQGDSP